MELRGKRRAPSHEGRTQRDNLRISFTKKKKRQRTLNFPRLVGHKVPLPIPTGRWVGWGGQTPGGAVGSGDFQERCNGYGVGGREIRNELGGRGTSRHVWQRLKRGAGKKTV